MQSRSADWPAVYLLNDVLLIAAACGVHCVQLVRC